MIRIIPFVALAFALFGLAAEAGERRSLGWSYLVTNDSIGEFRDRWQSSYVQGSLFLGESPPRGRDFPLGEIVEVRLSSQIITPESLTSPNPQDRPFAGVLGGEVLTHGRFNRLEASLGMGLFSVGPQTGSFRFQRWLHETLGFAVPRPDGREVPNALQPGLSAELGRSFGASMSARPFLEVRAGLENLLRAGLDISWGAEEAALSVRDPVTGHRVPGLLGDAPAGLRLFAGADAALVGDSLLLPGSLGTRPSNRLRLRAGGEWRNENVSAFYGLAFLGPEFRGQREGQFVGAFQLKFKF